jgi:hypothetical protein
MAFFAVYNPPVDSTAAAATDPSSVALIAELDSTNFLNQVSRRGDRLYSVNIWVGGSTAALWVVEHATSTNIASSAVTTALRVRTASNQHSQFVKVFKLGPDDRIRVRLPSTLTGSFEAALQAQEIA